MRSTLALQLRIKMLFWIVVTSVLLSVTLGGYWFHEMVERIGLTARQQTGALIQLGNSFVDTRSALADQTQDWKNSLLHAHDPVLFTRHRQDFQLHAKPVQRELANAIQLMKGMGLDTANIETFQQEHLALMSRNQLALTFLDQKRPLSYRQLDRGVNGAGRELFDKLRRPQEILGKEMALRIASLGVERDHPFLSSLVLELGALALVLPLIALGGFFAAMNALKKLGQNDRHTRAIFDAIDDATLVTDKHGRVQSLNARAQALLAWPSNESVGKPLSEVFQLFDGQNQNPVESPVDIVLREKLTVPFKNTVQLRRRDGSFLTIENSATPVFDAKGELIGVVMVFHAVSQHYQSARLLRESEQQLRITLKSAADAVFISQPDGRILYVNDAVTSVLGYSVEELTRMLIFDLVSVNWRERYRKAFDRVLTENERLVVEIRLIKKDGISIPMELNAALLPDGRVYGSCRDITGRKRAELALRRQVQFVNALNQLAKVIAVNEHSRTLLECAVSVIGQALSADRALIYEISFEQRNVVGLSEWLNPLHPDISATLATFPLEVFSGGATEMLHTRQFQISHADAVLPCLINDGSGQLLHEQMMIRSALWYPFDFREQSYHVLALNQVYQKRVWTLEEREFIAAVCQQLSIALNKLKMLEAQRLAEENLRIAAIAFESQQGAFVTDSEHIILQVNKAFTQITGYSDKEVVGHHSRMLSSGRHDAAFYAAMWTCIERTRGWQGEIWNRRKDGDLYPEWLTISAVVGTAGQTTHYVATFFDLTERKSAEDRINQLAFSDPLTNLPNRQLLLDRLQHAQAAAVRNKTRGALLLIDLDNFKMLNETHGHARGDLLLVEVAQRLRASVNDGDTVARLTGDKFALLLSNLGHDELEAAEKVQLLGQKVLEYLSKSYQLESGVHHSSASIGVTLFGYSLSDAEDEPLKRAELATYQAKTIGRNTMCFFETRMQVAVVMRAALEEDLREAVMKKQFLLHYQAQVVGEGRLTGAEVLLRWQHPQRGLVSPAEFIPLAEETGLILPLGQWVLESACAQLAIWARRPDMAHLSLAVNVSALQFRQEKFVDQVLSVIKHSGANPKRLKLELTESLLVVDVDNIIAKMALLKAAGVCFSLDDFGIGYSSLTYLKRLPLDQLKIDQSFVRNILTDANDAAISKMVIALADSMGLEVIAEGVEMQEQVETLANQGCYAYQGYLFSRPVTVDEFEILVRKQTDRMIVIPCL